jgi:membrane protein DedA with SNARE-associated domain
MDLITFIIGYRYWAIFLAVLIEGPIVMTVTGFIYKFGYFNFLPAFLLLLTGDLIRDVLWYGVGYYEADRFIAKFGKYFSIDAAIVEKIKNIYTKYGYKILFVSKITMGFGFALAVLITAGLSRVPLKKYILFNFLGGIVWTLLLMLLGYHFGNFYSLIKRGFNIAFLVFVIALLLAMLYGASKYLRHKLLKNHL